MTRSRSGQYLTGMCIAGLSVCAGGWLVVTAFISAGLVSATTGGKWDHGAVTILATGAGLALVAAVTFACWAKAWRRELRTDGVLFGEARRRSRRDARRQARQEAREARLKAAVARREARQARREARAMGKRERVTQAEPAQAPAMNVNLETNELAGASLVPGFSEEPEGVRPPNADRVLAQLRDLLGPLITALDVETAGEPEACVPAAREPEAREPAARVPEQCEPEPQRRAPVSWEPEAPRAHQVRPSEDLVAVCADGVISYDAEEAW